MRIALSTYSMDRRMQEGTLNQLTCIAKAKEMGFDAIEIVDIWPHDGSSREDYAKLLPDGLPAAFTVAEFGRAARLTPNKAGKAVQFFVRLGLVTRTGKRGRAYEYERTGHIYG